MSDQSMLIGAAILFALFVIGLTSAVIIQLAQKYRVDHDPNERFWQGASRFHEFNYLNRETYSVKGRRLITLVYFLLILIPVFMVVVLPEVMGS